MMNSVWSTGRIEGVWSDELCLVDQGGLKEYGVMNSVWSTGRIKVNGVLKEYGVSISLKCKEDTRPMEYVIQTKRAFYD